MRSLESDPHGSIIFFLTAFLTLLLTLLVLWFLGPEFLCPYLRCQCIIEKRKTLRDSEVYVFGGTTSNGYYHRTVEVYYPENSVYNHVLKRKMLYGTAGAVGGLIGKKIYIVGGITEKSGKATKKVQVLHIDSSNFTTALAMTHARSNMGGTIFQGALCVCGGENEAKKPLASCECFNGATKTWSNMKPMNKARSHHSLVQLNGMLYAIDDQGGGEQYDPLPNLWQDIPTMSESCTTVRATGLTDGTILACGRKRNTTDTEHCEIYHPSNATWTVAPGHEANLSFSSMVTFNDQALEFGGMDQKEKEHKTVFVYNMVTGWRKKDNLENSRFLATAVVGPKETVLY